MANIRRFASGLGGSKQVLFCEKNFQKILKKVLTRDGKCSIIGTVLEKQYKIIEYGPVSQLAEEPDLKSVQCGFEFHQGYQAELTFSILQNAG